MTDDADNENDARTARPRRSGRPPGRKPLAEGNAEDTRRELRRHAVRLFNERGYAAVSLDDIARASGVHRATVYYHFSSKEDVFLESVEAVAHFVRAQIEEIAAREHLSVRDRLTLLVRERRRMKGVAPSGDRDEIDETMMHGAMTHLSRGGRERLGRIMSGLHGLTENLIQEGITRKELPPLPAPVIDYAFWQLFPPDGYPPELNLSREEIEEGLLRLFFERLAQV